MKKMMILLALSVFSAHASNLPTPVFSNGKALPLPFNSGSQFLDTYKTPLIIGTAVAVTAITGYYAWRNWGKKVNSTKKRRRSASDKPNVVAEHSKKGCPDLVQATPLPTPLTTTLVKVPTSTEPVSCTPNEDAALIEANPKIAESFNAFSQMLFSMKSITQTDLKKDYDQDLRNSMTHAARSFSCKGQINFFA